MLRNYLLVLFRNLRKRKGYASINIFGLALGMACCTFILLFVQDERSFDRFHADAGWIYRINKIVTPQEGGTEYHALTAGLLAPALVEAFPEVEEAVRLMPWFDDVLLVHGAQSVLTPDVMIADSNFFSVFSFTLRRGDPRTVLQAPLSMVLTESTARAVFGEADPIGQRIAGLNNLEYTVTGIVITTRFFLMQAVGWGLRKEKERGHKWLSLGKAIDEANFLETRKLLKAAEQQRLRT
jgi:putative ABC transport system permease protein